MSKAPPERANKKMTESQVGAGLKEAPEWSELSDTIQRTFQFSDFVKAMAFVNEVAKMAEADQHHPDILVRYSKVTLTLSTHDAGGITKKDFTLAKKCDALFSKNNP